MERLTISLGKEFDYIAYIYYNGVRYINTDFAGKDTDNIKLIKLESVSTQRRTPIHGKEC